MKKIRQADKVDAFAVYLQTLGYAKSSVKGLPPCVEEFLTYQEETELTAISPKMIKSYYGYLLNRPNKRRSGGLSSRMVYYHLYSLRLFFNYLLATEAIEKHPMSGLSFPAATSPVPTVLSKGQVEQLYGVTESYREKALLHLYYGCGLRRREGERLNVRDIDFSQGVLHVKEGKNKNNRVIPLSKKVQSDLEAYFIYERDFLLIDDRLEPAFLINHYGRRLSGSSANKTLKKLLKKTTDLPEKVSLHTLRHSIATHLLEAGLSLPYIQAFLGHKSMVTTQHYTHIHPKKLYHEFS